MERKLKPDQVGGRFGVCRTTVIQWCESGDMPAINVASPTATYKRWRMSEQDVREFESLRENREVAAS